MNLKNYKNDFLFLPLGGSGEIGLNCNLYHYNGKWIIVDLGIGFIDGIYGVDVIVPDISFIKNNIKNFLGIFLTHIHDDHIGAIQYLCNELKLPIYASSFTINFLKERLNEYNYSHDINFIPIHNNQTIRLTPFVIEPIHLTHSTIEMNAFLIKTNKGSILHTGDWKFEKKPFVGDVSDKKKLKEIGKKNDLLTVVCESTNILKPIDSRTEADLSKNLNKIIKEHKNGLIVATLFASNFSRVVMLILAGKNNNRKIGIIGKSIYRIIKIANEMKLLPPGIQFIQEDDFKKYNKNELLILTTGCQGEAKSALNKLANDTYKNIVLSENDTVIFSSSIIPGNERKIYNIYNKLADKNVEVISNENNFVHVSGHYNNNDLVEFYNLIKPKNVITTHGENIHLAEHQKIAKSIGIKDVIKGKNGQIIKLDNQIEVIGEIKLSHIAIDGKKQIPINSYIFNERKKLAESGIAIITIIINQQYKLMSEPLIETVGNYNFTQEKDIFSLFKKEIIESYKTSLKDFVEKEKVSLLDLSKMNFDKIEPYLKKNIHKSVNQTFQVYVGKKPFVIIQICQV